MVERRCIYSPATVSSRLISVIMLARVAWVMQHLTGCTWRRRAAAVAIGLSISLQLLTPS